MARRSHGGDRWRRHDRLPRRMAGGADSGAATCELVDVNSRRASDRRASRRALSPNHRRCPSDSDIGVSHQRIAGWTGHRAVAWLGIEATVVEMSWYGDQRVTLALGERVSFGRLTLSIVAGRPRVAASQRARGTRAPPDGARRSRCSATIRARRADHRRERLRRFAGGDEEAGLRAWRCALSSRSATPEPSRILAMYSDVTYARHMMIAHSLRGEVFGPAQRVCMAPPTSSISEFRGGDLIRMASSSTSAGRRRASDAVLGSLSYRKVSTTRRPRAATPRPSFWPARCSTGSARRSSGDLGPGGGAVESLRVTLHESHLAAASCEAPRPLASSPMSSIAFMVPGPLGALTGGSIYDRRMVEGLAAWVGASRFESSTPAGAERAGLSNRRRRAFFRFQTARNRSH